MMNSRDTNPALGQDEGANAGSQSKHSRLSEWLRESIRNGTFPAGSRIPSENELAASFSYSRQTVRQAIGTLQAEGLLVRSRGSGTFVAKPLKSAAPGTMRIGVITTYLDDYVFPGIIHGIEEVLTEKGYTMSLGITHNRQTDEENCLRSMLAGGMDGLIVEGTKSALPTGNGALYDELIKRGIPYVFINGYYGNRKDSCVVMNDVKAGEMLTKILADHGHKKIGGIFKSDDMQGIKRYQGVCSGARRLSLEMKDDSVLWYTTEDLPYYFDGSFDSFLLTRLTGCTAVVCYNDQIAASFLNLLLRNGLRVPEDISLVSFDNSSLAGEMACNLTSVIYPAQEIGRTAAGLLLRKMSDPSFVRQIKLEPEVVCRGSVADL